MDNDERYQSKEYKAFCAEVLDALKRTGVVEDVLNRMAEVDQITGLEAVVRKLQVAVMIRTQVQQGFDRGVAPNKVVDMVEVAVLEAYAEVYGDIAPYEAKAAN